MRATMPPYDPRTTPSHGVGVAPETVAPGPAPCAAPTRRPPSPPVLPRGRSGRP
ncbi:hypothetical protein [Streptomyces albidoflavus]|uniref:hypothetical protein n=1 Tax=Streptomyces albidoflavus TaxID=1886 RepID=UPI0038D1FCF6